ncbi:MAG: hypothetical protein JW755_01985, partial [Candidatus Aminicenantes bacterium]|nr:hypothetical protein [Candidatus Aminicenantes bacterium]
RLKPYPSYGYIFPKLDSQSIYDLAYYFVADFRGEDKIEEWSKEIKAAVLSWKEQAHRSSLFFIDDSTKMLICDFRPGASDTFHVLQDPQQMLYKACDRFRSVTALQKHLKDETGMCLTEQELEVLLNPFLENGLMLEEDGKYLSLALSLENEYFPPEQVWNHFPEVLAQWDQLCVIPNAHGPMSGPSILE